jgi:hypothetical protein
MPSAAFFSRIAGAISQTLRGPERKPSAQHKDHLQQYVTNRASEPYQFQAISRSNSPPSEETAGAKQQIEGFTKMCA